MFHTFVISRISSDEIFMTCLACRGFSCHPLSSPLPICYYSETLLIQSPNVPWKFGRIYDVGTNIMTGYKLRDVLTGILITIVLLNNCSRFKTHPECRFIHILFKKMNWLQSVHKILTKERYVIMNITGLSGRGKIVKDYTGCHFGPWPGARFSKLPVITGPVKLFCFSNCTVKVIR